MKAAVKEPVDYIDRAAGRRNDILDRIAAQGAAPVWAGSSLKDVKKVVVIAAAPRSGSSLLFAILKRLPGVYSLSGESTPFYKLNGFSFGTFPSDEIPAGTVVDGGRMRALSRDFLSDAGTVAVRRDASGKGSQLPEKYIQQLLLRFALQWPSIDFSYEIFAELAQQAFEAHIGTGGAFSLEEFYLDLIHSLRGEYGSLNPYYYDIPGEMIREKFPGLDIPGGPPCGGTVIEEPPFILAPLRPPVSKADLADNILLLKSSADCYRMHFLESIFPSADIKCIYLTRNPLASINGLYDGWLHRGFFSHNLGAVLKSQNKTLDIAGYSDCCEWGKWWWKFDLPPDWPAHIRARLEQVCSYQWLSANRALTEYFQAGQKRYCRVRFENIINGLRSRTAQIEDIAGFMGLDGSAVRELELDTLPVVQATEAPGIRRWKKRKDLLLPLLEDAAVSGMGGVLGYHKEDIEEWL